MVKNLYFAVSKNVTRLKCGNIHFNVLPFSVNEEECEDKLTPSVELTSFPNGSVITYIFIENTANGDHTLLVSKNKLKNDICDYYY